MIPSVIGIDQGTTATKAFRLAASGQFEHLCSFEHRQIYPHPGWVEHDPRELLANIERCLESAGGAVGAGLANQGETVIAWNADTGEPIYNAIVWQDNRTQACIERLKAEGTEQLTIERAGLPLDPYFSASKLRWILDQVPEAAALARHHKLRLGTSDAFFLDRLWGEYATDVVTASRTSLMNLSTGEWDSDLCKLFGVPMELLPPIRLTIGQFGNRIPLVAGIVDQQAALFGHGCLDPGQTKITFGTGAFALALTGAQRLGAPQRGILPTLAWRLGTQTTYAIDGGVYNASSALDWTKRLGLFEDYDDISDFDGPSALERGLVFVPALSGLACPYWDRSAAGMWLGMGLETERRDLVRTVIEGVALRSAQAVAAMNKCLPLAGTISIDGGMSRNRYFGKFLASALGRTITVPSAPDLTGLGICRLALIGAGLADARSLPELPAPERTIVPDMPLDHALLARFDDAVSRVRGWRGI
ncbi:MAG: FGGY family carbohydrate kinase [Burkholderiales bacterium]